MHSYQCSPAGCGDCDHGSPSSRLLRGRGILACSSRPIFQISKETPTKDPAPGRALDFGEEFTDMLAGLPSKLESSPAPRDERPATPTLHADGEAPKVSTTLMLQPAQNSTGDVVHILLAQQALSEKRPMPVACCHDNDDTSAIAQATARVLTLLHPALGDASRHDNHLALVLPDHAPEVEDGSRSRGRGLAADVGAGEGVGVIAW